MADKLRERETGEEAKFKMDQELRFRAEARRDKLLGLWAAERLGFAKEEAAAFARGVVISNLDEPGDDDVVRHVLREFEKQGYAISESEVRNEMSRLMMLALEQVKTEHPGALDRDHRRVGD